MSPQLVAVTVHTGKRGYTHVGTLQLSLCSTSSSPVGSLPLHAPSLNENFDTDGSWLAVDRASSIIGAAGAELW